MKTLRFTFDGHDYYIPNADDWQDAPEPGDEIYDAEDEHIATVELDPEYVVCADPSGGECVRVHENEPDAHWKAVKAFISSLY